MITITKEQIDWDVWCEPEDIPLDGNMCAHDGDEECYEHVREEMASGNEWAWCYVIVEGSYGEIVERDSLGGCSFKSKQDFIDNSGYYDDMRDAIVSEINRVLNEN